MHSSRTTLWTIKGKVMDYFGKRLMVSIVAGVIFTACAARAQDNSKLPYMNPNFPPDSASWRARLRLVERSSAWRCSERHDGIPGTHRSRRYVRHASNP